MVSARRGCLYPLDYLYERIGIEPPACREIAGAVIPEPYHSLLVHENGMTVTLEQQFGDLMLRSLHVVPDGPAYFRRVLLAQKTSGRPVGMAAMRLDLTVFQPDVHAAIVRGAIPLGRILGDSRTDHRSQPTTYLEITPNSEMMGVFWMREPAPLYGRQTEMQHQGVKIGDIVEVLVENSQLQSERPHSAPAYRCWA